MVKPVKNNSSCAPNFKIFMFKHFLHLNDIIVVGFTIVRLTVYYTY